MKALARVTRRRKSTCGAVLTVALALSGMAEADELFSPSLAALGDDFLECRIVNVGDETRAVTIQVFDSSGTIVGNFAPFTVNPGQAVGISLPASAAGVYCKFTVEGDAEDFRASIDVLHAAGNHIVVALPAQ